jgi:hypothetical protein
VIILDANILIYAWNKTSPHHPRAKEWIERTFTDEGVVGIPWVSTWAFLRLTTNPRLFATPLDAERAFKIINRWLELPNVSVPQPGARHAEILQSLVTHGQATGALVSDAVLAALSIENAATLASTDQDFARFGGLSWINPLSNAPK